MNVLSSILYFIGTTIGANPSSLTTTSKTFVGAINEVAASVTTEHNRIHISTADPTAGDGSDGDIWIKYTV